jgi:hypothetical protein
VYDAFRYVVFLLILLLSSRHLTWADASPPKLSQNSFLLNQKIWKKVTTLLTPGSWLHSTLLPKVSGKCRNILCCGRFPVIFLLAL